MLTILVVLSDERIFMARYENKVLKPFEKLDHKEDEVVNIELGGRSLFGLLKGWKIDSQSLKDELRGNSSR